MVEPISKKFNIDLIEDILTTHQINQLEGKDSEVMGVDIFLLGFLMGGIRNSTRKSETDGETLGVIWDQIKNICSMVSDKMLSYRDKLVLYSKLINADPSKYEKIVENELDLIFNVEKVVKLDSFEERKLNEDEIQRIQKQDKILIEGYRLQKEHDDYQSLECPVCLGKLVEDNYWSLYECGHCFHSECLSTYLRTELTKRKFPIKCPFVGCKDDVSTDDVSEHLSEEEMGKYWEFTLGNYIDSHLDELTWCPTPDCKYAFIFDKNESQFLCPKCSKEYCMNCRCDYHTNMTCAEYRKNSEFNADDEKFLNFVNGNKFKQCPQCKFWVEKNQGCDHMTCRCGFQFCYKCGGVYQQCDCVLGVRPLPVNPLISVPMRGGRGGRRNLRRKK